MGWACSGIGLKPMHGLITLPGTAHLGKLYAAVRNSVEGLINQHEPGILCYVAKFNTRNKTAVRTAEALGGVQAAVDLVAYDSGLPEPTRYNERTARIAVLGIGDFGLRDPRTGGLIPDSGREEAKRIVLEWCAARGLAVLSHDVADAIVLLKYDQISRYDKLGSMVKLV